MPYSLLLGQVVYTSFAAAGYRLVASAQVPDEIQQAFIQRVVYQHWNSYKPPQSGYRAAYIHQISPEHNLFGWVYNDGTDEMERSDIPYFICYYLAEPLLFSFQLENIFSCLHKGPVALIDRQKLPAMIENLDNVVVKNFWSYESARPGVAIPAVVRASSHLALKQGQLLDLFLPLGEQETLIELSAHTQEQQIANLTIYTRQLVKAVETGAVTLNESAATIKARVIQPYQGYKQKLQRYEQVFIGAVGREYPIKEHTRNSLNRLQQVLQLRNEDVEQIEASSLKEIRLNRDRSLAKGHLVLTNKKSQLLFMASVVAIILAALGCYELYELARTRLFAPSQPQLKVEATNIPTFYKTLADVPNVPKGIFNYGGSTTFAPLRSETIVSAIARSHPQFKLRYTEPTTDKPGSGRGIKMLIQEQLSFAQSSRSLKTEEHLEAKKRGFTLEDVPVAIDGIAIYINPQMSLPGLTLPQLKAIFTGKVKNWKEVGGPDLAITPFSRNLQDSGTADFFYEEVLNKEPFDADVQEVRDTTTSIRQVAKTPGSIGYATASEVRFQPDIRPLALSKEANQPFVSPFSDPKATTVNKTAFANGSYPITRRLFVIIKEDGEGEIDEQAGFAYANLLLSEQGQQLVEQAGFVPIR